MVFAGNFRWVCDPGIGLVLLFQIRRDNFLQKFLPSRGMQSVCLLYAALQLSVPALNSHPAASKFTSYGYEQFSFRKNPACCFRIRLS